MARVRRWIPVVLWAILISTFSTDIFSSRITSRFIVPALRWLFPHASMDTIELLHHLIRKGAHVFEYFFFGTLLFRAIRGSGRGWTIRWAASTIALAAVYAAGDEFHQSFVPSRGASPWDALLDTAAAATAVLVLWLLAKWSHARISGSGPGSGAARVMANPE